MGGINSGRQRHGRRRASEIPFNERRKHYGENTTDSIHHASIRLWFHRLLRSSLPITLLSIASCSGIETMIPAGLGIIAQLQVRGRVFMRMLNELWKLYALCNLPFSFGGLLRQLLEVAGSLRYGATEQTDHDASLRLATDRDIEVDLERGETKRKNPIYCHMFIALVL